MNGTSSRFPLRAWPQHWPSDSCRAPVDELPLHTIARRPTPENEAGRSIGLPASSPPHICLQS
ncbi:hypothetical protein CBM2634_B110001 [Cupriavidus taiwanensis]|uniref:Uncharacterized protein n=1 Tax=Cupriavidus taiwanensis TaxID=164546 RepID=A0A375J6K1_9BURK|nr:hypothetical protein CBM2634_B110001 [Cupriavidus taiwanensis]